MQGRYSSHLGISNEREVRAIRLGNRKRNVVFTSGTFDLFHIGHLNILKRSKALGDKLIVGVSTDELVASYKKTPPIIPFKDRVEIISSCSYVDQVVKQTELTSIKQLIELDVDIVTIGDDWKDKYLPGLAWVERQPNKTLVYLPYTTEVSTTEIKRKVVDGWHVDKEGYFKRGDSTNKTNSPPDASNNVMNIGT